MPDAILKAFLTKSHEAAMKLAAASDLVSLLPEPGAYPQRYLADFHCRGLVRDAAGAIVEANHFRVGIWFPDDYLRDKPNPYKILTLLEPATVFHPNIRAPFICAGDLRRNTDLVSLLFQIFELLTYQKWAAHDPLDPMAAEFARNNMARFPIDPRPLRRRAVRFLDAETNPIDAAEGTFLKTEGLNS
jgi:ubiquitin-protein ligase